jgi:hypothetical protein
MFYFRRQNTEDLKRPALEFIDNSFERFTEGLSHWIGIAPDQQAQIRGAFSQLIDGAIRGTPKRDGNYNNPTGQQIADSRKFFIEKVSPYMSPSSPLSEAHKININTLIHYILEVIDADNVQELNNRIHDFSGEAHMTSDDDISMSMGGHRGIGETLIVKPKVNLYDNTLKQSASYINNPLYSQKLSPSTFMVNIPTSSKKEEDNKQKNTRAKGTLLQTINETNEEAEPRFTSFFGKYGFDMYIDESGGYVLKPLNTEQEYNTYLQKYNLNIQDRPNLQRNVPSGTSGGKIKTRKSRIFKDKTRKIKKLRNKRNTRKNIKKLTKRKTKHRH